MSVATISTSCPKCKQVYKVKAELGGKKVKCKKCKTAFVLSPGDEVGEPEAAKPEPVKAAVVPTAEYVADADDADSEADGYTPVEAAEEAIPIEDDPIPLDDTPLTNSESVSKTPRISRVEADKVEILASGHYLVTKIMLSGKMIHVAIEKALNEYAEKGWRVEHILPHGNEAYAIMTKQEAEQ